MRTFEPGDLIAHDYEIIKELGGGAFGTVFEIRNLMDDRHYALKLFRSVGSRDEVQREMRALRAVSHPNIVRFVWAGSIDGGEFYLITELIEGPSLDHHPAWSSQLPLPQVRKWSEQILSALTAVHPNQARIDDLCAQEELDEGQFAELQHLQDDGLIHRDIKPANILVRPNGDLVLADFNIASRANSQVLTVSHSADYQPPDADLTRWTVDTDLFATGVLIYELVCGEHPYEGRQPRHPSGPRDPLQFRPTLPAEIRSFLLRGVSPGIEARFDTGAHMLEELNLCDWDGEQVEGAEAPTRGNPSWLAGVRTVNEDEDENLPGDIYEVWEPHPLPSATSAQSEVIQAMREIVEKEGPMVCQRLYELYVAASDDPGVPSVKAQLNRAAYAAVSRGVLAQLEPLGGGQADKTVYIPRTPSVVMRELGPRQFAHVPRSELEASARWFDAELIDPEEADIDDLIDLMLSCYGGDGEPWILQAIEEFVFDIEFEP